MADIIDTSALGRWISSRGVGSQRCDVATGFLAPRGLARLLDLLAGPLQGRQLTVRVLAGSLESDGMDGMAMDRLRQRLQELGGQVQIRRFDSRGACSTRK